MADKKAAKKLAAEMQRIQQQKDFLVREKELDQKSINKLKDKWFEIFLNSKLPEMKENLRSVLDYMEKLVELEVFRKRIFEEEKVELSDQIDFQAQNHNRMLENLYDLYLQRIRDLHEIYTQEVVDKKKEAEEHQRIIEKEILTQENLKAIIFQTELNQEKKIDAMKCNMFLRTDDEKNKNAEKIESLRTRLELVMEKKWHQISSTLMDYQRSTEHRRNHYIQLRARDKHDSKVIHCQMRKTQKLFDQIQQLKNQLENPDLSADSSDQKKQNLISEYKEERNKFYKSFVYLKKLMQEEMKVDDTHLKELVAISRDVIDYLSYFLKKGERIVTLYSLCLKLETEKEKVVPVGNTLHTTDIFENVAEYESLVPSHELTDNIGAQIAKSIRIDDLQNFWRKFGKVRLSIVALSKCVTDLEEENKMLKKIINSYLKNSKLKTDY